MNYIISMTMILLGTVLSTLGGSTNWHWLLISDCNVAIALFLAWYLDMKHR